LVILLYLLLALAFTQTLHFSRALDEGYHLEYITFIKQHGRLPTTYEERAQITRADFPPLYHLLVALISANVRVEDTPDFKVFWDSFRYRAIDHGVDTVWTLETEDFQWPYIGRFLVWQLGRWVSVVLSVLTVTIVYFTLRETPLGQIYLAPLAAAALLAFIPRYVILGSAVNDDNLLGLIAALYFWMLVKAINKPTRWWPFVAIGLFLGLSMTVKYSLVLIPLEVIIVFFVISRKTGRGWNWLWLRLGLVGLVALLSSSWWFGWNMWHLNSVAEDGWVVGLLRPLLAGGSDTTLNRLSGFISGGQLGLSSLPENTIIGSWPAWARSTFLTIWGVCCRRGYHQTVARR
jgi:4-amino-4-deoxy-L-arabinose transferase-like glycosyltransferase